MFKEWHVKLCDVLDKANQLTGNNKGERRYKISLCKVCFLARKDKQCDRQPSPLSPAETSVSTRSSPMGKFPEEERLRLSNRNSILMFT